MISPRLRLLITVVELLIVAVAGNMLVGEETITAMTEAFGASMGEPHPSDFCGHWSPGRQPVGTNGAARAPRCTW